MTTGSTQNRRDAGTERGASDPGLRGYVRFGSMIAVAMAAMYALTYMNSYQFSHVRWSETRGYMTLIMGAMMAIIMLGFMLGMYRHRAANIAIVAASIVSFVAGTYLVRSQTTVQDRSYMGAMIPHHSIAILTSENSQIVDVRVCDLAVAIIEAQRREIEEMSWLIADIERNGPATTRAEANARPVPVIDGTSLRSCPS